MQKNELWSQNVTDGYKNIKRYFKFSHKKLKTNRLFQFFRYIIRIFVFQKFFLSETKNFWKNGTFRWFKSLKSRNLRLHLLALTFFSLLGVLLGALQFDDGGRMKYLNVSRWSMEIVWNRGINFKRPSD